MKFITATNTLLGKHNVTSNQADWQFGSSRFFEALFVAATAKPECITNYFCLCCQKVFPWQPLLHYVI